MAKKKSAPRKTVNAKKSRAKAKAPAKKAARKPAKRAPAFTLGSIAAGFTANDAAASVKWYCDVLGFMVRERWEQNGRFLGASVGLGPVTLHIGQDDWRMGRDRVKGQGTRLYITTGPGIEQYAADVQARGGVLDQPLSEGWGFKTFGINDPDNFKLSFMTPLKK